MQIEKSKALFLIDEKIAALENISCTATPDKRYGNDERYHQAYYGSEELIATLFSDDEAKKFRRNVTGIAFAVVGGPRDPARDLQEYRTHLARCVSQLKVYREKVEYSWPDDRDERGEEPFEVTSQCKDVFIVYGHDDGARYQVENFVGLRLHLGAIMFDDVPDEGMTIIEKLEELSKTVGFAVVILTPDDIGSLQGQLDQGSPRARQNVILELGYFLGKLGRKRVCILKKGNMELPSDLAGVLYKVFDAHKGWQAKLQQEFERAGLLENAN